MPTLWELCLQARCPWHTTYTSGATVFAPSTNPVQPVGITSGPLLSNQILSSEVLPLFLKNSGSANVSLYSIEFS